MYIINFRSLQFHKGKLKSDENANFLEILDENETHTGTLKNGLCCILKLCNSDSEM